MKHFILSLLFTGLFAGAKAQFFSDSLRLKTDSFPNVPYKIIPWLPRFCFYDEDIIDSDSAFDAIKERCKFDYDSVDFSKEILMYRMEGGDCHARYYNRLYLDTAQKTMFWIVYNIWGGCRAGGGRSFWMVAPKPPEGYTILFRTYMLDREDDPNGWWKDEGR
jgi:hypothetical protein